MKKNLSLLLVIMILFSSLTLSSCKSNKSYMEFVTVMEILKKKYNKNDTMTVLQDEIKDRGLDQDPDSYVCILQSGISGDVEIPGEHEGAPVVAAASRKSEYGGMTSLKVSNGIRCLVGICYRDSSSYSIKKCSLPEDIAVVSCFSDCDCIKELDLSGVSEIKDSFSLCSRLRNLKVTSSTKKITGGSFNSCDDLEKLELPGKFEKLSKSFRNCTFLKELSISKEASGDDEIKEINECFDNCIVLEKISLNASVRSMTDSFNSLNALKTLNLEKMPDKIDGSFSECKAISEVVFREPVKEIKNSFNKNKSLKKVTFEKETREIENSFCNCAALTEVSFKARAESVKSSFNGNEALEKVSAPGGFGSVNDSFRDSTLREAPDELKKAAETQPEEKTPAGRTSIDADMASFLEKSDSEKALKSWCQRVSFRSRKREDSYLRIMILFSLMRMSGKSFMQSRIKNPIRSY